MKRNPALERRGEVPKKKYGAKSNLESLKEGKDNQDLLENKGGKKKNQVKERRPKRRAGGSAGLGGQGSPT